MILKWSILKWNNDPIEPLVGRKMALKLHMAVIVFAYCSEQIESMRACETWALKLAAYKMKTFIVQTLLKESIKYTNSQKKKKTTDELCL